MKGVTIFFAIVIGAISSKAFAWDSVAVFYKPEKVLVLVNESGREGRLKSLMKLFGPENEILKVSEDQSFKMDCGKNATAASCTFRFLRAGDVRLFKRGAEGHAKMSGLISEEKDYFVFENSNGDRFWIRVKNDHITFRASKNP